MKCYIIRHAHKEFGGFYNPDLRHNDEPISTKGHAQAQDLLTYFSEIPVEEIYVSQYLRTHQTSEPLAQKMNLTPIEDSRLNEVDNGVIEELSDEELAEQYPDVWAAYLARDCDFRFPEGETGGEALARIKEFLEEKQAQGKDIIAICHDGLVRVMMCYVLDIPVYRRWDFKADFCGITEIEYQPDYEKWKLLRFNQACR